MKKADARRFMQDMAERSKAIGHSGGRVTEFVGRARTPIAVCKSPTQGNRARWYMGMGTLMSTKRAYPQQTTPQNDPPRYARATVDEVLDLLVARG